MSTANKPVYEWNTLPWKQFERQVFKLQKRIYKASRRGDVKTVHRLQRLLMKSWAAECLAVRRVTQDNKGKKTAGIDGVKNLRPPQRLMLTRSLTLKPEARPVRRVWIPKPGKTEKRPLGIPVMRDRAIQTLVRLALEPEWEARFEPNSYGFRPGRSCHDAIEAVFHAISTKAKYVLDADITACFDRINHEALLNKLHTFPTLRRIIRGWLEAGVMDGKELFPTTEGTPQGGALSPLLANIALHGLETYIRASFPYVRTGTNTPWKPVVVRYADDFIVLHEDLTVIHRVQQIASEWLAGIGLELKPSKTRITHTFREHDGRVGFDFLGFTVRQYRMGKNHTAKATTGKPLGFKTFTKPSSAAQKRHYAEIAALIKRHGQDTQENLIKHLNLKIAGWARYYSSAVSKRIFSRMDTLVYRKLKHWAERRHPKKTRHWVARHYWRYRGTRKWVFKPANGPALKKYADTPIRRHVKVKGDASPFDGNWVYWGSRLGRHPELPKRVATLLKWQDGKCALCELYFKTDGVPPEVDHIVPTTLGGKDGYINWQLLHRHCHDQKTATDGSRPSAPVGGTHVKGQESPR